MNLRTGTTAAYFLVVLSIFATDFLSTADINFPILYIACVILSYWHEELYFPYLLTGVSTILAIIGAWYFPVHKLQWDLILLNRSLAIGIAWMTAYIIVERRKAMEERKEALEESEKMRKEVKELTELLPMCAWCRKIRDDKGYWEGIEGYFLKHAPTITHGICPQCSKNLEKEIGAMSCSHGETPAPE